MYVAALEASSTACHQSLYIISGTKDNNHTNEKIKQNTKMNFGFSPFKTVLAPTTEPAQAPIPTNKDIHSKLLWYEYGNIEFTNTHKGWITKAISNGPKINISAARMN